MPTGTALSRADADPQPVFLAREQRLTEAGRAVSSKGGISAQFSSTEYGALLDKIKELQDLLQQQRGADVPLAQQQRPQPQQQQRGTPRGFRVGTHPLPAVGFDRNDRPEGEALLRKVQEGWER
ncbi:hypothetical protein CYMTET_44774 [Cymbomonas tetramitiformis]|uniref:Uncharacterized protein n=1 Tax=Cymbomonas tetramitiformis TaxID=36881 RepID=A0AAE0BZK5_9CHLO|nr:hypothetical protein CYMTET_44774 [Cymbomonas tetramitiformis]